MFCLCFVRQQLLAFTTMDSSSFSTRRRLRAGLLAVLAATALAACGGGIFIGYEFDGSDGVPPDVSIAVSPTTAARGEAVKLVAAASDDQGIDHVSFHRLDGNIQVRLATDCCWPYEWITSVPQTAAGSVSYFARATDFAGNQRDSNVVTVTVTP